MDKITGLTQSLLLKLSCVRLGFLLRAFVYSLNVEKVLHSIQTNQVHGSESVII